VVKMLQTLRDRHIPVDHKTVRTYLNTREKKRYDEILKDVGIQSQM